MWSVPGYQAQDAIAENRRVVIFRALRERDQCSVVVKTLQSEYPSSHDVARLRKEYEVTKDLAHPGLVKSIELVPFRSSVLFVMEDFGGEDFASRVAEGPLEVGEFLDHAVKIADALGYVHQQGLIHRDIKCSNLLFDPAGERACIIDFSIASQLSSERQKLVGVQTLEGSLQYMSPEQTGRMNRPIDWRTDFYSLGVSFYEMLTGKLPFIATAPMELVHCHLAKTATPVHEVRHDVPRTVSEIVTRLMAKTAEERYQNAYGLMSDLERCRQELGAAGAITRFELGRSDQLSTFRIPDKLYGRDAETAELLATFDDVCEGGTQMVLVKGYSGVGKSALIEEIHKPIVRRRGYFISSKFDQYRRDIPYVSIRVAFNGLVRQLLTEPDESVRWYKARLLEVLDNMGQVIIDVIPDVELLIGEQPPVVALEGPDAQNRFVAVFEKFLSVFTSKESPLVFFLDDLQWADLASLRLLEAIVQRKESHHLLILGAYRDNEVTLSHPLMLALDKIRKHRSLREIHLLPLSLHHTKELIADTLRTTPEAVLSLAELIHLKTHGNPLFLRQLLSSLYDESMIRYSFDERKWSWDLDQIRLAGVSDQVVDLMTAKIRRLPAETQALLEMAACLGNQFDLRTLATVREVSPKQVVKPLFSAVQEGLLLSLDASFKYFVRDDADGEGDACTEPEWTESFSFKFLHDRVHEAAYARLGEQERKRAHLRIGLLLRGGLGAHCLEEDIFDVVNHLNLGVEYITDAAARTDLAELNLIAGKKARSNTAHFAARDYLARGLDLMPRSQAWSEHYDTMFQIHRNLIECEYLCENMSQAEALFDITLENAQSRQDKADVYELMMNAYMKYGRFAEGVELGRRALAMYRISLPEDPKTFQQHLDQEYATIERLIADRNNEELAQVEANSDKDLTTSMSLLHQTWNNSYFAEGLYDLGTIAALRIVTLSLEQGYTSYTPFGYVTYGLNLSSVFGHYEMGDRFGRLAVILQRKFDNIHLVPKINNLFAHFISHYRRGFAHSIAHYEASYHACLQTGDLWYGLWAVNFIPHVKFIRGDSLDEVYAEALKYHAYAENSGNEMMFQLLNMDEHMILNLQGKTEGELSFNSDRYDEQAMVEMLQGIPFDFGLFWYHLYKSFVLYLYGEHQLALTHSLAAEKDKGTAPGLMLFVEQHYYSSLILCANFNQFSEEEKQKYRDVLDQNETRLRKWGQNCPENYAHKHLLVAAEIARVEGRPWEALSGYEKAITAARDVGAMHNAAIACELATKLLVCEGHELAARGYLGEARYHYKRWGASRKVTLLEREYGSSMPRERSRHKEASLLDVTSTTSSNMLGELLDLNTMLQLNQMLSREIVFTELLRKMLGVLIENAGAEKGVLLVQRSKSWDVAAHGSTDEIVVLQGHPYRHADDMLPISVIQYVLKTGEAVVLEDAQRDSSFGTDAYIQHNRVRSLLCIPIKSQSRTTAILYLENNLAAGSFTPNRINVLEMLSAQVAISTENALLYADLEKYSQGLEQKVEERTQALREKNTQLESKNQEIVRTQQQLVTHEKMASLGTLTAGVAHEINNPTNFVNGSTQNLVSALEDFERFLYDLAGEDAEQEILDALRKRMSPLFDHTRLILNGTDRIRAIVKALQSFSRINEAKVKEAKLITGLSSTISLVRPSYKNEVLFETDFRDPISIECRPAELNQVFMNIIVNGCQAIMERRRGEPQHDGRLLVSTWREGEQGFIEISDNGVGIPTKVQERMFEPFFTTKSVGEGTGLGLSISYGIVQRHGGEIRVKSTESEGSSFTIMLPGVKHELGGAKGEPTEIKSELERAMP